MYWGSCKRKFREQNPMNLACHVISYFNNRGFSQAVEWDFKHIFLFLSPEASSDQILQLLAKQSEINQFLQSSSDNIRLMCQKLLSNTRERGKAFQFNSAPPPQFFQVAEFRVYNFSNF